jgi:hypothetical protein
MPEEVKRIFKEQALTKNKVLPRKKSAKGKRGQKTKNETAGKLGSNNPV